MRLAITRSRAIRSWSFIADPFVVSWWASGFLQAASRSPEVVAGSLNARPPSGRAHSKETAVLRNSLGQSPSSHALRASHALRVNGEVLDRHADAGGVAVADALHPPPSAL